MKKFLIASVLSILVVFSVSYITHYLPIEPWTKGYIAGGSYMMVFYVALTLLSDYEA